MYLTIHRQEDSETTHLLPTDQVQHVECEVSDYSQPGGIATTHPLPTDPVQHVECEVPDHSQPGAIETTPPFPQTQFSM